MDHTVHGAPASTMTGTMPRRIMLDVGGHVGETLVEVVKPRWAFDRIYTFEPASSCWPSLVRYADHRVEIVPAGWWNVDGDLDLHDPGQVGASLLGEKARTEQVERCRFVDAAAWLRSTLDPDDLVWLKLNCEGAECVVLDHLYEQGELRRIDHLVVHFDVEKIPSLASQAVDTRERLDAARVEWIEASTILCGRSHALRTANWLAWTEASGLERLRYSHLARWEFRAR